MKNKRKQWIWWATGIIMLVAAVVLYMVLPLGDNEINERAVAGQAASYYNEIVSERTDSCEAPEAGSRIEGYN